MKLDGIAMITRVVVWQKGYFRHKQRNTSCIVIVDLKFHTKRRRAKKDQRFEEEKKRIEELALDVGLAPEKVINVREDDKLVIEVHPQFYAYFQG